MCSMLTALLASGITLVESCRWRCSIHSGCAVNPTSKRVSALFDACSGSSRMVWPLEPCTLLVPGCAVVGDGVGGGSLTCEGPAGEGGGDGG